MSEIREFRVYKPKGKNQGSALKLQFRVKPRGDTKYTEPMLFIEIATQKADDANGNSRFDWMHVEGYAGASVTMKLGIPDVAELLLCLHDVKGYVGPPPKAGQKVGSGLFHKNQNGNTVMKFAKMTGDFGGYATQLSTSREHSFRITLTQGEAMILRILLEEFTVQYYGWKA